MIRFAGPRRLLGALLLLCGLGALGFAGLRAYSRHLRTSPSGPTAGGAATVIDLCRRGTPPDVAAACIAEAEREDSAARSEILRWALVGASGLLLGAGLLRRRRTGRIEHEAESGGAS